MILYVVEVSEATRCWVLGVFQTISKAQEAVDRSFEELSRLALEIYVCKTHIDQPHLDGIEVIWGRYSGLDDDDNEIWSDWIWEE